MIKKKFQIIDDDKGDRMLFQKILKNIDESIICTCSPSWHEAADALFGDDTLPDIIFLDVHMSGVNGWECLNILKRNSRTKQIPVVMFTGSSNEQDIEKAVSLGATSYCVKPGNPNELKELLSFFHQMLYGNFHHKLSGCNDKHLLMKNSEGEGRFKDIIPNQS